MTFFPTTAMHANAIVRPPFAAAVLPQLERRHADWANRIYRSGALTHPDGARLVFCLDADWTPHAHLRLMAGPERLVLRVESLPGLAPFLAGPFDSWPQEEWCTLVEIAAAPLLEMLAQALGTPLHVAQVHLAPLQPAPPETQDDAVLSFRYLPQPGAPAVRAALLCGGLAGLRLPPPAADRQAWHDLPMPLRLGAGSLRLAARELAALRAGDVLRGDTALSAEPLHLQLLLGARPLALARVGIDPAFQHHLEIVSMSTTYPSPAGPDLDAIGGIDDVGIHVQFHIGSQQIRLRELASLRPGALIALGVDPLAQCVAISANGTPVGKGELVVVEEELAVRITAWTAAAHD